MSPEQEIKRQFSYKFKSRDISMKHGRKIRELRVLSSQEAGAKLFGGETIIRRVVR